MTEILYKKVNGKKVPLNETELAEKLAREQEWELDAPKRRLTEIINKRMSEYLPIGDQLDAILKYLETKTELTPELSNVITHWKGVKQRNPKE